MADTWGGSWASSWALTWTPSVEVEDVSLGGGTYQGLKLKLGSKEEDDKRWQKRRRQLEKIARLIDGVAEEMPADVPEAQIAREAKAAVEKAADKLAEDVPLPFFDWAGLASEVRRAEAALSQAELALAAYHERRIEEDDEDILLLMV